ncbi:MAG: T9SS type A sorting domain-containing protein [candidate division Zixibacteria bacterium]|nr:T9SS type A sorting domain-containing protein [candidate division Zixibacteria bacterium]
MKLQETIAVCGVVCLAASMAVALPPKNQSSPHSSLSPGTMDYSKYVNANKLLGFVSNQGHLFYDGTQFFGRFDGLYFPYTSVDDIQSGVNDKTVVYSAGLWMGGCVGADTLVSVAEYSSEYVAGNMKGGTFDPLYMDAKYRVYKLYRDSMAANPNADYLQWPVAQGAPVDGAGHPLLLGDQTAWCVFSDAKADEHTNNAGGTSPLGIEVRQTVWATDDADHDNVIFLKYQLFNRGTRQITGFYISLWADPDLGGASDDLVGCDTLKNTFFAYNATNTDSRYGSIPPAWGGRLLCGPIVPRAGDSAISFGKIVHGYRNLGMTAFSKYINGTDPASHSHSYNYMRGLMRDGSTYMYMGNGLRYANSGNPVTQQGDLDEDPADRRLMATSGPITFNPGDSQEVIYEFATTLAGDRLTSLSELLYRLSADTPTDVSSVASDILPEAFSLSQNYPNPFNAGTSLEFALSRPQSVRLDVYNMLGQRVTTLVDRFVSAGVHRVSWNGESDNGLPAASGVYEFRLNVAGANRVVRGVLLK